MLKQVGETGLALGLILRADFVPNTYRDNGCLAVFVDDNGEAVIQCEFVVRDVDVGCIGCVDRRRMQQQKRYAS